MLTSLTIFGYRLGFGLSGVKPSSTGLVGFGSLVSLGAFAFEYVLGTFYQVVSGFLHSFGGFFHEAVVGYCIGGVAGQVLHLIGGGSGGSGGFG